MGCLRAREPAVPRSGGLCHLQGLVGPVRPTQLPSLRAVLPTQTRSPRAAAGCHPPAVASCGTVQGGECQAWVCPAPWVLCRCTWRLSACFPTACGLGACWRFWSPCEE